MNNYDPSTNPRHLAPVVDDPEWEEQMSQMEAQMQRIIDAASAQISMFESRGWQYLDAYIDTQLESAQKALRSPRPNQTMDDIQLIRGQVLAWEALKGLPKVVREQRDYYINQARQYRNTQ